MLEYFCLKTEIFQHYDNVLVSSVFYLGNDHVIIVNHVTILTRRLYVVASQGPYLFSMLDRLDRLLLIFWQLPLDSF